MKDFFQKVNSYVKEAFGASKYLFDGITVTFDHLKRRPVTVQYLTKNLSLLRDIGEEFIMNLINALHVKFAFVFAR